MGRLVMFSIGSICLGLVAAVGLAAYTAAHPLEVGLIGASTAVSASRHGQPALAHWGSRCLRPFLTPGGDPPPARRHEGKGVPRMERVVQREIPLLDHLIRPLQERRGDRQAERVRGLEVDHQLEVGGLLYG
jgi:hypothetical protein